MFESMSVRPPAVADRFYPADPRQLRRQVEGFLESTTIPSLDRVRAIVAPHAGYMCSGSVAGHGFRLLQSDQTSACRVYLIGPAHWGGVDGVGLSLVDRFETPLGDVEVDTDEVQRLLDLGDPFEEAPLAHGPEHCLEVQLPFLQVVQQRLQIVPMLLGSDVSYDQLVEALAPELERRPKSIIVASSDLSHYLPEQEAKRRDGIFLQHVLDGNRALARRGDACGLNGILTLMGLSGLLGWQSHLLAYGTSGDTCGPRSQVVGYASLAYTERTESGKS